jgi:hypothetical protein
MTEEIKTKKCIICGQVKSLDDFYACAKSRDKRGSYCKLCANEYGRQRVANSPEVQAQKKRYNQEHAAETCATRKIYRDSHKEEIKDAHDALIAAYPTRPMIYEARKRAKAMGIPCTITEFDIEIPKFCPVLGIPIIPYQKDNNRDSCPSLDRVNLNYGYVPGNVCVMSYRANRLKNDGTIEEHDKLLKWMLDQPILLEDVEATQKELTNALRS